MATPVRRRVSQKAVGGGRARRRLPRSRAVPRRRRDRADPRPPGRGARRRRPSRPGSSVSNRPAGGVRKERLLERERIVRILRIRGEVEGDDGASPWATRMTPTTIRISVVMWPPFQATCLASVSVRSSGGRSVGAPRIASVVRSGGEALRGQKAAASAAASSPAETSSVRPSTLTAHGCWARLAGVPGSRPFARRPVLGVRSCAHSHD